jgi:hypothetical protein
MATKDKDTAAAQRRAADARAQELVDEQDRYAAAPAADIQAEALRLGGPVSDDVTFLRRWLRAHDKGDTGHATGQGAAADQHPDGGLAES